MIDAGTLVAVAYVSSIRSLQTPANDAIVRAVERAAAPYAAALEREADRADATYDGLTGLLAPRAFRCRLRAELERCEWDGQRRVLCLWFVDTDSFKFVNDSFGHRAGDGVLQAMASLLQSHLVAHLDVAGRNGGDEFCAVLRGVSKSRAIARAQAFCEAVRAHDFGLPVRVTASVGVATYPHDASNSSELLEMADAAMYHSKRNGRDRVSFVAESGSFRCAAAKAVNGFSRKSSQCRSYADESFASDPRNTLSAVRPAWLPRRSLGPTSSTVASMQFRAVAAYAAGLGTRRSPRQAAAVRLARLAFRAGCDGVIGGRGAGLFLALGRRGGFARPLAAQFRAEWGVRFAFGARSADRARGRASSGVSICIESSA